MFRAFTQIAGASMIAQLLTILVMPLITRLQSPDSLGKYQLFATIALVVTPLVTGSLDLAIKNSSSNYQAASNLKVAMQYSLLVSLILLLLYPIFFLVLSGTELDWFIAYLPLLYIFVYLSANFQYAMAHYNSKKNYGTLSTYTLTKSIALNSLKVTFSIFLKSGNGLILALVLTEFLQLVRVLRLNYSNAYRTLSVINWEIFTRRLAKNRVYPTYVSTSSFVSILMNWYPVLLTGAFYGSYYAGLLGLAFMVVNTPVYPMISALQSVCFGELAREKTEKKLLAVYGKSMFLGAIPAVFGLILLGFYGEKLFGLIFGNEWNVAGDLAFISFVPVSMALIFSPIYDTLNHLFSFQKIFLILKSMFLLVGGTVTTSLAYYAYDFKYFLMSFSIAMSFMHLVLFLLAVYLARIKMRS